MLTVYSAHGSPGASTTAMYLAAQWASTGTEVLLVEADPGGGSLSHHLGIQFTPGSASFVASGLPVRSGNLIDHSQDVLFNSLHVMPATSSPTGAREIVRWWNERAGELRDISESEMAVIVDAGRITADSVAADLAAHAAGVLVVAGGDSSQSSREHIGSLLSAEACGDGVERGVVTVGDSPLSAEEWREKCDLTFYGSIMEFAEVTGDLSAFLNRNKRKSKKWRVSLEEVAEKLLPYAKPASGASRAERLAPAAEAPPVPQAPPAPSPAPAAASPAPAAASPAPAAASPPPAAADEPQEHEPEYEPEHEPEHEPELHDGVPATGAYGQLMPQPDPYYATPAEVYGQATPPPDDRYNPPAPPYAAPPPAPTYQQHPAEQQPMYFESPPAPPEHQYYDAPLPVYQPPPAEHEQPQPQQSGSQVPPELLEVYQQHGVAPSWAPSAQESPPYQQQAYQPEPELPPPYQQQAYQPQPEPPPQYQQQAYQPQPDPPPQYQQQAYEPQPEPPPQYQQQAYQPQPSQHEAQQPQQPQQPQHEAQRYQQQPQQPQQPQGAPPAYQHATQHPYQQPQQPQPPQSTAHHPQAHQPAYGHTPSPQPASHAAPSAAAPAGSPHTPAGAQPPPLPDMAPSGSFRDWANRMHAQAPQGTSNSGHGGGS